MPDALTISPQDRDIAIRTMLGEEGSPDGMAGVASTILNRAQSGKFGGKSLTQVAFSPGQFESWTRRAPDLLKIPETDSQYQQAAQIFDGVASGKIPDLTNGATHFYAPAAQKKYGRQPPDWGVGQPIATLGRTLFFAPKGPSNYVAPASQAINAATGTAPPTHVEGQPYTADEIAGFNAKAAELAKTAPDVVGIPGVPSKPNADLASDPLVAKYLKPSGDLASDPLVAKYLKSPTTQTASESDAAAPAPELAKDSLVAKYLKPAATQPERMAGATPSPYQGEEGLVRNSMGAFDPKTGELVVGGKPMSPGSQLAAASTGAVSGVPIAGPPLLSGVEKGAAAIAALRSGQPMSAALPLAQDVTTASAQAYPKTALAGNIAGAVAGTIPAMVMAPAAFGVGGGGVIADTIAGAGTGAVINAADAGMRNGFTLPNLKTGAATGALFGAAGPVAGKLLGAGMGAISNVFTGARGAPARVAGYLADLGLSPADVQAELTRLGPDATLADVDPALTTKATALAAKGGAPTSILKNAFTARAEQADSRVGQAIDQYLGPKPDLTATKDAIYAKAQAAASPFYDAARANPMSMDVAPILAKIDSLTSPGAGQATGGTERVLNKVRDMLTNTVTGPDGRPILIPKDDPQSLLNVRQELDDMLSKAPQNPETTGAKNAVNALKSMRGQLDDVLKADPNIKAGDAAFSQGMKPNDALQSGQELFQKGTRIEDFKRALATASPEEIDAMRQGARIAIGDAFETARQGQLSAARSMFGKSTANRAKLDALFPQASDVFDKIAAEQTLRSTEQRVVAGSKTAEAAEAMKEFSVPTENGSPSIVPAIIGHALGGAPGMAAAVGGKYALGAARTAFTDALRSRFLSEMASGLSATGPQQSAFLQSVGRAHAAAPIVSGFGNAGNVGANLLARGAMQQFQTTPISNLLADPRVR